MPEPPGTVFEFGAFRLETTERRLLAATGEVHLTPKTFDVLCLLVREAGRLVTKQQLLDEVWPHTFIGDAALARSIADLRKALGETAADGRYIATVSKRGYRFVAPVRTVASPHPGSNPQATSGQEPGPEPPIVSNAGMPRETGGHRPDAGRSASPRLRWPLRTTRWRVVASIVFAGLLVTPALFRPRSGTPTTASAVVQSLAVLPFTELTDAGPDDYLALGITDALITRLSAIRQIAVRPTATVRALGAPQADPLAAGRVLKVDAVLEGSVQRHDDRLRLNVRLLNTASGRSLWAATFDERLDDLFTIEDSISARVVEALSITLLGADRERFSRRDTANADAHRVYLEGRYVFGQRTRDGVLKGIDLLERAVRLDRNYALAYAGLADAYLISAVWAPPQDAVAKARTAAEAALRLDPSLAEAHTALALIAMNYDWDWAEAERRYRRAIDLNPAYPTAHHWYGEYLAWMGRFAEGIAEVRRAEQLDPLSLIVKTDVGKVFYIARRYDEAVAQLQHVLELDPNYSPARLLLAGSYIARGSLEAARAALSHPSLAAGDSDALMAAATIDHREHRTSRVRAARQRMLDLARRQYVPRFHLAVVHLLAGDKDAAFAALERLVDERAPGVICLKVDATFDPLRSDPRFAALLRRAGFAAGPEETWPPPG